MSLVCVPTSRLWVGRLETIAEFPEGEVAITNFSRVGEIEDPS